MPDRLKALSDKHDRANARRHRLTGEPILPVSGSSKRRICIQCRRAPNEAAMAEYQRRYFGATDAERAALEFPKFHHGTTCPHCGGELVGITG